MTYFHGSRGESSSRGGGRETALFVNVPVGKYVGQHIYIFPRRCHMLHTSPQTLSRDKTADFGLDVCEQPILQTAAFPIEGD
jgi:hypothetical protein